MSDSWVLDVPGGCFSNRGGVLHVDDVSVPDLVGRFGSPLYVMSENRIRHNFKRLHGAFSRLTPFRLYYAVKANTNLAVLGVLRQEGAFADCSCPAEIYEASLAGFGPEKILYTGNYNSTEEVRYAQAAGVTINFDDAALLGKLEGGRVPETVCFRINPGMAKGGKEGLIFAGPDAKFGSPEEVAARGYAEAKKLGAKRFGIHMMTGSNVLDPKYFPAATSALMDIAGRISKKVGMEFEFVNVGGGFGVPYSPKERELPIEGVASSVVEAFRQKVEQYGMSRPLLAAEPGRFLVADSAVLASTVCHVKSSSKTFVGVDAGMNTLLRPALYNAYHPVLVANRLGERDDQVANICGQVCENTDVLARDRGLPRVKEGDIIAIFNAGAYGFAMSSQYNNRPRAAEVLVNGSDAQVIRRREGFSDLVQGVSVPARLLT
ncbi:MAG: diaminopimelate decarboxylase [Nitrososphaerota archaeon]|nr:diaminopimelate decarboxylase [Nitrososphaerota archaeon]MDG6938935.1 diaminopimelate decarboxylase [Nitrososphaerota archaeon]